MRQKLWCINNLGACSKPSALRIYANGNTSISGQISVQNGKTYSISAVNNLAAFSFFIIDSDEITHFDLNF